MLNIRIDAEAKTKWAQSHCLVCPEAIHGLHLEHLKMWVRELQQWPESPCAWMKYFETGDAGERLLCRVENFIPFHRGLRELVQGEETMNILANLMGEPASLFKEKVNFKLPGGSSFGAHQDAPAFGVFGHRYHVTMMVCVDDATPENGCLEMSTPVEVGMILDQDDDGTIAVTTAAQLDWKPLPLKAGDVVFFDSYIPHRSTPNRTDGARRALYLTYNPQSAGDLRDQYFAEKRRAFPPECERADAVPMTQKPSPFNLGNPIR